MIEAAHRPQRPSPPYRSRSPHRLLLPFLIVLAPLSPRPLPAQTATGDQPVVVCMVPDSVGLQVERIARRVGGEVGVAAIHLESGARVSYNGGRRFPMASVSKLPIALEFLRRVDSGEIRLDDTIVVRPTEFRAGYSPMAERARNRPVKVTLDSLFSLMIAHSDNSATDVLLGFAGGPEAATRRVRELGIEEIDVDRSEARTFADLVGLPDTVPEDRLYRTSFFRMRDRLPADVRQEARLRYGDDPRDTATPDAMADLLARVWEGAGLSEESRDLLLEAMREGRSGPRRIRGLLPLRTEVAHKTGTMAGAINDVGIVTLPGEAGHMALAVFVNTLHRTTWRRERTIAQVARLLHDYFASTEPYPVIGPQVAACAVPGAEGSTGTAR